MRGRTSSKKVISDPAQSLISLGALRYPADLGVDAGYIGGGDLDPKSKNVESRRLIMLKFDICASVVGGQNVPSRLGILPSICALVRHCS